MVSSFQHHPVVSTLPSLFLSSPQTTVSHSRRLAVQHKTQSLLLSLKRKEEKRREEKSKMSWQSYVDDHLMCDIEGNHLTSSAILGHDGVVWAQSPSFPQLKPEEVVGIMDDFNEPGTLAPTGLYIGGTKYMVIQGEPGAVIRGKKGSGGVTIKKTTQSLIFGIYDEPVTPGQCNIVVERIGDYLIEQGY